MSKLNLQANLVNIIINQLLIVTLKNIFTSTNLANFGLLISILVICKKSGKIFCKCYIIVSNVCSSASATNVLSVFTAL